MYGFEKAQAEYERGLECPYDIGGACFDWEEYEREKEEYAEIQAEMMFEQIWSK